VCDLAKKREKKGSRLVFHFWEDCYKRLDRNKQEEKNLLGSPHTHTEREREKKKRDENEKINFFPSELRRRRRKRECAPTEENMLTVISWAGKFFPSPDKPRFINNCLQESKRLNDLRGRAKHKHKHRHEKNLRGEMMRSSGFLFFSFFVLSHNSKTS
jgi:hypothetical protein